MIISASRRTDIPAFFVEWFFNRLREGVVLVRNPLRFHQVSRIDLSCENVDGFVFWTKNPAPMLPRLRELGRYPYYFLFTLTSYEKDVEPRIPPKFDDVLQTFMRLADEIGPHRVIWRYDPILLSGRYGVGHHIEAYEKIAHRLRGFTYKCIISFVDPYRNTARNKKELGLLDVSPDDQRLLARELSHIAAGYGMTLETCAEAIDLSEFGIGHARCVDAELLGKIAGRELNTAKDKNQRAACGCAASVDIGAYNTCPGGCKYCYANYKTRDIEENKEMHNVHSPLLIGGLVEGDVVKDRVRS